MAKTATREYELTYLENSSADGSQPLFDIDKFLDKLGAKVTRLISLGEKFLSYPIKKTQKARIGNLVFETDPEKLPQIEQALQLEDKVLRYLIVKEVISPAEKVKPAIKAAEKVVESKELDRFERVTGRKKEKATKAPPKEEPAPKKRIATLDKKLDELLGETEEEK